MWTTSLLSLHQNDGHLSPASKCSVTPHYFKGFISSGYLKKFNNSMQILTAGFLTN